MFITCFAVMIVTPRSPASLEYQAYAVGVTPELPGSLSVLSPIKGLFGSWESCVWIPPHTTVSLSSPSSEPWAPLPASEPWIFMHPVCLVFLFQMALTLFLDSSALHGRYG